MKHFRWVTTLIMLALIIGAWIWGAISENWCAAFCVTATYLFLATFAWLIYCVKLDDIYNADKIKLLRLVAHFRDKWKVAHSKEVHDAIGEWLDNLLAEEDEVSQ